MNEDIVGNQVAKFVRLIEAADFESELPSAKVLEDHCEPKAIIAMAMFDYLLKHKPGQGAASWDLFLREALQESINADIASGQGDLGIAQ